MTQPLALVLSLAVELPVVVAMALAAGWAPRREWLAILFVALGATLLTHPFAWHAHVWLMSITSFPVSALVVESVVIVVEGSLYATLLELGARRGLLLSALANGLSFLSGLCLA